MALLLAPLDDGKAGKAIPTCNGIFTTDFSVLGNAFYSRTVNQYRAVTGHELGHSLSIGYIPGRDFISLMGYNSNSNVYYTPQQSNIDFVNQFYP